MTTAKGQQKVAKAPALRIASITKPSRNPIKKPVSKPRERRATVSKPREQRATTKAVNQSEPVSKPIPDSTPDPTPEPRAFVRVGYNAIPSGGKLYVQDRKTKANNFTTWQTCADGDLIPYKPVEKGQPKLYGFMEGSKTGRYPGLKHLVKEEFDVIWDDSVHALYKVSNDKIKLNNQAVNELEEVTGDNFTLKPGMNLFVVAKRPTVEVTVQSCGEPKRATKRKAQGAIDDEDDFNSASGPSVLPKLEILMNGLITGDSEREHMYLATRIGLKASLSVSDHLVTKQFPDRDFDHSPLTYEEIVAVAAEEYKHKNGGDEMVIDQYYFTEMKTDKVIQKGKAYNICKLRDSTFKYRGSEPLTIVVIPKAAAPSGYAVIGGSRRPTIDDFMPRAIAEFAASITEGLDLVSTKESTRQGLITVRIDGPEYNQGVCHLRVGV
jgi:hypothetical protein